MIQTPRPSDLLSCLLSRNTPLNNVARTRDSLFLSQTHAPLITILRQVFFPEGKRYVLVCIEQNRLRGVVSSRARAGASVWEVNQLLLPIGEERLAALLLDKVGHYGRQMGAHKIFLRIERNSLVMETARQAGFLPRSTEYLFRIENEARYAPPSLPAENLKAKTDSDEFHIFHLYSAITPPTLMQTDGMTLQEWQASRDRCKGRELVYQEGDSVMGWLRLSMIKGAGVFELMALPSASGLEETMIEYSLAQLRQAPTTYCIAQEHQTTLHHLCIRRGFQPMGEYSVLLKQVAVPLPQHSLAPLQV
ncbi:MAG: hypothetical protein HW414_1736 [Dehalococcoidia bacterium]|nr:hypothetical protein [Dehalococcoidia bacterium]